MSIAVSQMVWSCRGLDPTAKLVLLRLADSAQDDGTSIFPSVPRIAADCSVDERTAQRAIARLREAGLVVLVAEADASKRRAREYRIDLTALNSHSEPPAQRHPRQNATPGVAPPLADCHPRHSAALGVADCHPTPGTAPPLTIIESSLNRQSRRADDDEGFQAFWSVYPKKQAKADAQKAWKAAVKKTAAAKITAAAERYAEQCAEKQTPAEYIKLAGGWLRSERWADFQPEQQAPPPLLAAMEPSTRPTEDDETWKTRAEQFHDEARGGWRTHWGPDLLSRDCRVPPHLLHLFH
ncbi:helix-turn-helix domain-containing protein [Elstera cyanobacteriorum]|uniref:helix-turn-helix domain-containing protein n=1 Tax=Elstera cyanobacteriorum TaxID=2022747 RepID=UPI0023575766|nr:helix-turn-helix domain-containing protein [Elstera cyanobacteriorum]MCK6444405.1 helix-turn-helix domain-containing protein [Elstera cyanobacteriorum]